MKTVPVLYSVWGTVIWIVACTALHGITAILFAGALVPVAQAAICVGFLLLVAANGIIFRGSGTPEAGLRALPLFHVAITVYAGGTLFWDISYEHTRSLLPPLLFQPSRQEGQE